MNIPTSFKILALSLLLLHAPVPLQGAQKTLILNTAGNAPLHRPQQNGIIDLLVKEAFSGINIEVYLQHLPAERALMNANLGIEDGDAARIGGLTEEYPNLIQVPARIFHTDFVAFTRDQQIIVTNWRDLEPYHVGIIVGHKISEANVKNTRSLTIADDTRILFTLLKNERVDIVVCEYFFGMDMVKQLGLTDVRTLSPPLATLDFYIYLHKKHALLVDGLVDSINQMNDNGTYSRIYRQGKTDAGY